MSSGWVTVEGRHLDYLLRMPSYEVAHIKDPANAVFANIRFSSGFSAARLTAHECHDDPASSTWVCAGSYEFAEAPGKIDVECSFHQITVTNHIHMLRATRNGKSDQAILDSAFPSATLAFRPPTIVETAIRQSSAGLVRVFSSAAQVLLLLALILAARSSRELTALGAAFIFGEVAGTMAILHSKWQPTPGFSEAAVALALAYLALEILVFPKSKGRWLLALVFGGFIGMYFSQFVSESGYYPGWVLSGAATGACVALLLGGATSRAIRLLAAIEEKRPLLTKVAAGALMVTGSIWFIFRLRG